MAKNKENIPVIKPYNPLDKRNLGENVAKTMLSMPTHTLPPEPFIGAGVYALYYRGDYEPYRRLSDLNREAYTTPIYVGKAVPAGARKGGLGLDVDHGLALYNRLSEHATSISCARNLKLNDFVCRYLVVDDIWIPLAESMLIEQYKPLWNRCIDGFGNHDPGKGRYQQQKSPWDCIHEGREWAARLKPNSATVSELLEKVDKYIDEYCRNNPVERIAQGDKDNLVK